MKNCFKNPNAHRASGRRGLGLACLLFISLSTRLAHAQNLAPEDALSRAPDTSTLEISSVTVKRLDAARNGLSPTTGTSLYHIDQAAIQTQAQGDETPINHVLLSAPCVAQDSYGQIHVRGEHADVQYRLNGILLPEGISGGFAQDVDTRFADQIDFLTGALPAQYGDRTAGVVDIHTKSGAFEDGGRVGVYGGSNGWLEPSLELQGHKNDFNYYLSGSYLQDNLGIEAPTSSSSPLHDKTQQEKGFAYLSYILNPTMRVSAMLGSSLSDFQIPDNPGQTPSDSLSGVSSYPSSGLNETQREVNNYATLALQGNTEKLDYQVALFVRHSSTDFSPDSIGDLIYNGVASHVYRGDNAGGLQADASWVLTQSNTLRAGGSFTQEKAISDNTSSVFAVDSSGQQSSYTPENITDNNHKTGYLSSLYLQDEWKLFDPLMVNYGLRFDDVSAYVKESQLSPRINILYTLNAATHLHAGYSRYFSPPPLELVAPSDLSLFKGTTNAPEVAVASNVRSERDNYYDIGVVRQLFQNLQLGLDGYYKDADHLLDEGQFGAALVFTPFNYATGKVYGAEASAKYHDAHVTGYINAAYSVAKGETIESSQFSFGAAELAYIATHEVYLDHDQRITGSAGLAYTWVKTTVSLDAILGSGLRRGFANTDRLPVYGQVNLGASQHIHLGTLGIFDARLSVINVLDNAYELRDGSGIGVGAPQWGPRRALYVGLSKPFSF
jgi:outer membrane receptor for ferrienterochelin and colicin